MAVPRAISILRPTDSPACPVADTVILDYAQRSARGIEVTGVKGGVYALAFDDAVHLRTDDRLQLDDGRVLEVVAAPEPLIEARASDLAGLARLAWQLGDRHVPVQVLPNRIRLRRDPGVEALLNALGAKIAAIEAPFDPEGGAYASAHPPHARHDPHHGHDHDHEPGHDHDR